MFWRNWEISVGGWSEEELEVAVSGEVGKMFRVRR